MATDKKNGLTATRTFTVTVTPANPTLPAITAKTVVATTQLKFTVTGTPAIKGDALSYSLAKGTPAGAAINATTGVFTWTPPNPIAATITIVATDKKNGLTASQSFKVTVSGAKPTVSAGANASASVNAVFTRSGTCSAPSYEKLTATIQYGDGSGKNPLTLGKGTFSLSHKYTKAGAFTVIVTLTDQSMSG